MHISTNKQTNLNPIDKLSAFCIEAVNYTHSKLILHNKIGEGLYSNVFVGSFVTQGKKIANRFAVKISDKSSNINLFLKETSALSEFIEQTNLEHAKLYSTIKKMRQENTEEYITPKEIYDELTLLEPLPMLFK